jgi:long-chain acyl-CoA synthetase
MNNSGLYKKPLNEVREIKNLKEMLEQSCDLFGEKPAFFVHSHDNEKYLPVSYIQLKKDIDSLGTVLLDMGLKEKRIAVIGENRYEWAVTYLAVVNGVGVIVPIDKELPENEIESLIIRSEAEAVVFSGKMQSTFEKLAEKVDSVKRFISMDFKKTAERSIHTKKSLKKARNF